MDIQPEKIKIAGPAIREGWLRGNPGKNNGSRGSDVFVKVEWSIVFDLIEREIERIKSLGNSVEIAFNASFIGLQWQNFPHQILNIINSSKVGISPKKYASTPKVFGLLSNLIGFDNALLLLMKPIGGNANFDFIFNVGMRNNDSIKSTSHPHLLQFLKAIPFVDAAPVNVLEGSQVWLPLRPATESSLLLALCTELIKMAASEWRPEKSLVNYLCEGHDGQAFDATWAEGVCGIDALIIKQLALRLATSRVLINIGNSASESSSGEQTCRSALLLASLLNKFSPCSAYLRFGMFDKPIQTSLLKNEVSSRLDIFKATKAETSLTQSRMAIYSNIDVLKIHPDINHFLQQWKSLDTIIVAAENWSVTSRHADIVIPLMVNSGEINSYIGLSDQNFHIQDLFDISQEPDYSFGLFYSHEISPVEKTHSYREKLLGIRDISTNNAFPMWDPGIEWLGSPLSRRYSLHLIKSMRGKTSLTGRAFLWMHPNDALQRGLFESDIVRIWNDRGACLAELKLCSHRRPQTVEFLPAEEFEPIAAGVPGSLDIAGVIQILLHDDPEGYIGWDCLVEIEAWRNAAPPLRNTSEPRFAIEKLSLSLNNSNKIIKSKKS
ncbi:MULTISPECIES: molybdopterin-dependent oxidoreductase [Enterobacterales]|uniref:molybdopterin-dependent oxidoreductase n=1 Tax=Enterobacterales TaxID=91347 RepID=UPI0009499A02|nr:MULTISPECIES: molybdopterin-dependent oxidoreductase [Enterobacterales]MBU9849926.1 molybdopterin-dependent oxidoreductase [Rahnella aceris]MDL5431047.1 molybdopterin dinucleotide binding domain-containing protein [Klebsiella michiganensis]HBM2906480.1 molybdopterin-dependent oxidoreductase [Klebsiella michiganensis]